MRSCLRSNASASVAVRPSASATFLVCSASFLILRACARVNSPASVLKTVRQGMRSLDAGLSKVNSVETGKSSSDASLASAYVFVIEFVVRLLSILRNFKADLAPAIATTGRPADSASEAFCSDCESVDSLIDDSNSDMLSCPDSAATLGFYFPGTDGPVLGLEALPDEDLSSRSGGTEPLEVLTIESISSSCGTPSGFGASIAAMAWSFDDRWHRLFIFIIAK